MIVHNIFPTCVAEFDLQSKVNTKLLWNEIKSLEKQNHSLLTDGGQSTYFPGNMSLLDVETPLVAKLKKEIQASLNEYTQQIGLIPVLISNSWLSTMDQGTVLLPHRHEASVLSGAYYPNVPEGSVGLTFMNPLKPYRMCEVYDRSTEYSADEGTMPVREGCLYLFPSWLEHKATANQTKDRAVISFNTVNNALVQKPEKVKII